MARIVQREVRKRGLFGKLFKLLFILFNILMAIWLVAAMAALGELAPADSEAGRAGQAIGVGFGLGMILILWAIGDVILGILTFFTRGRAMLITEEAG